MVIGHTSQVHPAVETSLEMVKILILLALGLASCEKLDRTYLPPIGSKFAGGSSGDLQVPLEPPNETFPSTHGQSGRNDGLPTLSDSQVELGISRGIPSGNSQDLEISTPAANTPFTYFQNAYNVPTTTTSYAFSQTTTLPPGQSYDITSGPFNPTTGFSSQNPTGYFQTTIRPYPQEQYNQNPNYVQYGPQSTPRPDIVSLGNNPLPGYVYPTPEEQAAHNGRPTYAPGTHLESLNQYQGQQPTSISHGNVIQIPSSVQLVPDSFQYSYGQQPININQQGILSSTVSSTSQQPSSNITFGNAVQAPGFEQSYNPQNLIQTPYSQRPINIGQQVIPSTVSPTGSLFQEQFSLNNGQQNIVPSIAFQGSSEISPHFDNNLNVQPFGPYDGSTPQSEFLGEDSTQFTPGSNVQSNQPTYGQNVYQPSELGSIISQQNPSTSGRLGDSNQFKIGQNVYNPTTTAAPGTGLPSFSSFSGIPSSTPSIPSGASYPGGVYASSTTSPAILNQDTTSMRYKIRSERPQAEADRTAVILNYENDRTPEGYSYSFDTSNGIHADESGVVIDGTKAKGSYSYIGDDGKLYSVSYTADENGFQPRGDHLPTSPPIPEAIQRVIEQAARDRAAGISDDGTYDEAKYGHKNYQGKYHPQDQKTIFSNGADIPDMNEHQFSGIKNIKIRPQTNQIKPVSTTEDYEINDYGDGQVDYENDKIINNGNKKQVIDDDTLDSSEGNILTQDNAGFEKRPSKYLGSQQNNPDLPQNLESLDGTSNDFVNGRLDNPSKTNYGYNKDNISSVFQEPGMRKQTMMGRTDENNNVGPVTRIKESGIPQSSGPSRDNTNVFGSRQTNVPSNFRNKYNQPSLNPRAEFSTLQPISEETGYEYTRPKNKFSQEDNNRFPSRFMETNQAYSTRRPSASASTTAKPFITPNIYRTDEETEDEETDEQTPGKKPANPTSGTPSKYDEGLRLEYGQSTTPDQIIGDDEISYTTVAAPRKSKPGSSRRPSYAQTTTNPNQYQGAYDISPANQKGTIRPAQKGGNRYSSSTTFSTPTPSFASSTTPMSSTFTTMTPQRTFVNNRYQTTYKPSAGPNFSDQTVSPGFSSSMRPESSRTPSRLVGSTQSIPSTTFRPNYDVGDKTVKKLAPGVKVDGFGRPITQYNQYSDATANPSITTDYPLRSYQNTDQTRPSSDVRGSQRPALIEGINTTFMPGAARFSQPTTSVPGLNTGRPIPGSNQSTGRVIGEDFSGPKRPQTFDPETGYHYK